MEILNASLTSDYSLYYDFKRSVNQIMYLPSATNVLLLGYGRNVCIYNLNNKQLQMFIKDIVAVN
jgi:hypothetical protein